MASGNTGSLRRILAVDDDPVSLAIAVVLLQAESCEVVEARSGEQALDLLSRGESPDCILADLRMPSLSGPELASRLRAAAPRARLFAMSATPPPRVEGYDAVLRKPLSPEGLRNVLALTSVLHGSQLPPESGSGEILDAAVFDRLRRSMSASALDEVISSFLDDTLMRLRLMRTAGQEAFRREAHTIKGGAAMIGALRISAAAAVLESGIDHIGERRRKLDELELDLDQTEVILNQRLKI